MRYTSKQQDAIESLQHDYRLHMGFDAVRIIDGIFLQAGIYAGLTSSPGNRVFSDVVGKLEEMKSRVDSASDKCAEARKVLGELESKVKAAVDAAAKDPDAQLFK